MEKTIEIFQKVAEIHIEEEMTLAERMKATAEMARANEIEAERKIREAEKLDGENRKEKIFNAILRDIERTAKNGKNSIEYLWTDEKKPFGLKHRVMESLYDCYFKESLRALGFKTNFHTYCWQWQAQSGKDGYLDIWW